MRRTPSSPRSLTICVAPKSTRQSLPRLVTAHRNDAFGAAQLGGEDREQTDSAVADHRHRHAGAHVCGIRREPTRAHDVGDGKHVWKQFLRGRFGGGNQRAVGKRHAQYRRLRPLDVDRLLASGLVSLAAVRARIVRSVERADDELPRLDRANRVSDRFHDAAILVAGRRRPTYRCDSSIVEEIRAADARGRHADKRIGRFDDGWIGARFVSYVARPVQYGAFQVFGQPLGRGAVISTFKAMTSNSAGAAVPPAE